MLKLLIQTAAAALLLYPRKTVDQKLWLSFLYP
nr:MAG TPA: hypothetical protein [Caudoviricetes sp.]